MRRINWRPVAVFIVLWGPTLCVLGLIWGGWYEPSWTPPFRLLRAADEHLRPQVLRYFILVPIFIVSALAAGLIRRHAPPSADRTPGSGRVGPTGPSRVDRLGRAPFVRHLADLLVNLGFKDGLVFGLPGGWGSGKSTVVRLVEEELKLRRPRPRFVAFHSWLNEAAQSPGTRLA